VAKNKFSVKWTFRDSDKYVVDTSAICRDFHILDIRYSYSALIFATCQRCLALVGGFMGHEKFAYKTEIPIVGQPCFCHDRDRSPKAAWLSNHRRGNYRIFSLFVSEESGRPLKNGRENINGCARGRLLCDSKFLRAPALQTYKCLAATAARFITVTVS